MTSGEQEPQRPLWSTDKNSPDRRQFLQLAIGLFALFGDLAEDLHVFKESVYHVVISLEGQLFDCLNEPEPLGISR